MDNTVNHWQGGNNVILNYGEIDKMVGGQFKALGSGVYNVEDEAASYWRTGLYNAGKIGEISGSFSMVMKAITIGNINFDRGIHSDYQEAALSPRRIRFLGRRASILFNVNERQSLT